MDLAEIAGRVDDRSKASILAAKSKKRRPEGRLDAERYVSDQLLHMG